ncbi:MAG: DUF2948 family protein [Hyphomicrobiales bacterium]
MTASDGPRDFCRGNGVVQAMKMAALDAEDLIVLSSLLEGARFNVSDMTYQSREQRFVTVLTRREDPSHPPSITAGLHFDRVTKVQSISLPQRASNTALTLIGIMFNPAEPPSGHVILAFEGDIAIKLTVECLEVALSDLLPKT